MDQVAFSDFPTAATAVLQFLQSRLGFDLWMVTRAVGEDWVILNATDTDYGVESGDVFKWSDSFCSRMVAGVGPRVAPRSTEVLCYAEAPIGHQLSIRAYIGVPLTRADGTLFGTLCAVDTDEQKDEILAEQPMVELMAQMLSTVLERDLAVGEIERRAQQLEDLAMLDALTGLPNRRAWDGALAREEQRCERFGHPATVVSIDLDGLKHTNDTQGHEAGDALLRRAAKALHSGIRVHDTVARTGGDEFALLAAECAPEDAAAVVSRVTEALADAGIDASIGFGVRRPGGGGLEAAWRTADANMYRTKAIRKAPASMP
ncbi:MAG TPA: sensor domain-containing diguanylate cyclase [Acidimicrobiales bacterium]|nr:sensor domain-containing diguanylate cyclase [Acidimicrobiales bacterium]